MGKIKRTTVYGLLATAVIIFVVAMVFLKFKASQKTSIQCVASGCNGEICQNKDSESMASICLWKEKFVCYKTAKCEVQKDGTCGWTMDQSLTNCLSRFN